MIELATFCLALNIYHEARSDIIPGQYAVALVTMNRAEGKLAKVCPTVLKPKQFSWTNWKVRKVGQHRYQLKVNGIPQEDRAWDLAVKIADVVISNSIKDFTFGATHYHTVNIKPRWSKSMGAPRKIGQHYFYNQIKS